MLATLGARSFSVAAPKLWNNLPAYIRGIESLGVFKRQVKTSFFFLGFYLCNKSFYVFPLEIGCNLNSFRSKSAMPL